MYITTALYSERVEEPATMPWLQDLQCMDLGPFSTSATFAHTCKIRRLQSYIMHMMQSEALEGSPATEWHDSMRQQIDNWADEIYSHR